jgi:hypothetical protein
MYKRILNPPGATWKIFFAAVAILVLASCSPSTSASHPGETPTILGAPSSPATNATTAPTVATLDTVTPQVTVSATPTTPAPAVTTTQVTATTTAVRTATATRRPLTPTPRVVRTATPAVAPGVYVTAIKINPLSVPSNQTPQFSITFLNTTGIAQPYRWFVKIYEPDQPQSFGETSKVDNTIAIGTSQLAAPMDWKTQTFFSCLPFIARAFWVDQDNNVNEFLKPDGKSPATGFQVCP